MAPENLNELFQMMKSEDQILNELYHDWSSLPTFGGDEPKSTIGIWSWDEKNMIIGTCANDIQMVPRDFGKFGRWND